MFCPIVTCLCNYILLTITCNKSTTIESINNANLKDFLVLDITDVFVGADIRLHLPSGLHVIPLDSVQEGKIAFYSFSTKKKKNSDKEG